MENASETPASPTPPPPDLPRYTPPVPSFETASESQAPVNPPAVESAKIKIRVVSDAATGPAAREVPVPFNTRVMAAVIDSLVAFGLTLATYMILPSFFGHSIPWLVGMAYYLTRDSLPFLGGQSVGKKAMRIKVVTSDDQSLAGNWQVGLVRNVALAIPLFAFVELYILLTREDTAEHGRRLGDEWANTKIVAVPKPEPPEEKPKT